MLIGYKGIEANQQRKINAKFKMVVIHPKRLKGSVTMNLRLIKHFWIAIVLLIAITKMIKTEEFEENICNSNSMLILENKGQL